MSSIELFDIQWKPATKIWKLFNNMKQLCTDSINLYIKVIKILLQGNAINVGFKTQNNRHKIWLHILDILLEATLPTLKQM